ncbi:MAG: hypothetical protein GVY04_00385 [Cyanobacteria bacterium]|jgi:hypothetical protein|nr:hypothetical protein [Cyanobacteria bacterium GSL.Bin1]
MKKLIGLSFTIFGIGCLQLLFILPSVRAEPSIFRIGAENREFQANDSKREASPFLIRPENDSSFRKIPPDRIVPDSAHPDFIPPVIGKDYYNSPSFPTGTIPKFCRYPTIGLICIYSDGLSEEDKIVIKNLIEDYFFDRQVIFLSDS